MKTISVIISACLFVSLTHAGEKQVENMTQEERHAHYLKLAQAFATKWDTASYEAFEKKPLEGSRAQNEEAMKGVIIPFMKKGNLKIGEIYDKKYIESLVIALDVIDRATAAEEKLSLEKYQEKNAARRERFMAESEAAIKKRTAK